MHRVMPMLGLHHLTNVTSEKLCNPKIFVGKFPTQVQACTVQSTRSSLRSRLGLIGGLIGGLTPEATSTDKPRPKNKTKQAKQAKHTQNLKQERCPGGTRTYMTVRPLNRTIVMFQIISHIRLIGLPLDAVWRSTNETGIDGSYGA